MAGQREHQPADGIDILAMLARIEIGADDAFDVAELGAGGGDEDVGVDLADQRAIVLVVLVLDLADHGLEQILDGDDAVGAAILVDDDGHVDALQLHLLQQIAHRHQRRHEQHGAQQCRACRASA